jgi:hypothetical protein
MPLGLHNASPRVRAALGLVIGAILVATLTPASQVDARPMLLCVVCGERGTSDVVLNILLFAPLGALLAIADVPRGPAWLGGALLSAGIEGAQLFIRGRDSSIGDLLSNTIGTVGGYVIALSLPGWARAVSRHPHRAALAAAAAIALVIAGTGTLLRPSYPDTAYYGQWTADLGYLAWYRGRVLSARLGSLNLPSRRLDDSRVVREALLTGVPLEIRALAGPRVPRLAPLFSIYDEREREILLVGPDRDDLVLRYRTRAAAWGLDHPDLRLRGAVRDARPGDTLVLHLWREKQGVGNRTCLTLNNRRSCELGIPSGRGWALLLYPMSFPPWAHAILDAMWVAGLCGLLGFMAAGNGRALALGAGLGAVTLATMPLFVGLLPASLGEWLGAAGGLALGAAGWRVFNRVAAPVPRPARRR